MRLKLNCDKLLSTSAFKFNLRRYMKARDRVQTQILARVWLCLWHMVGRCRLTLSNPSRHRLEVSA
jgi:hypothetical protein